MKQFLLAVVAFCFAGLAIADGHGDKISFEQRHEGTPMEVTSVHLNADGGTITAEGQMGTYGRTYVTYKLTARPDGKSGWVDVEGRGAMADGAFASGAGVGIYSRNGTTFTIHFLVNMQDGTQNLDEVVFNAYTRELTHDVYVVQ
ncbi:MAG: hypothetical protein CME58_11020 [Halieaceae bacterium]|nr:hypothetical protein [Halieaceae bacterium]|tara:strand:- start:112 stop:546 length:435 start_codon:yes stop_codon:yes gene_type:complete